AHPVADLAAQQFVDRHPGCLAGDVPECHLDSTDSAAPGLEAAEVADPAHDPLDVGRVLAQDQFSIEQHVRLEIWLEGLRLGVAADARVGHDANYGIATDDRASEIRDFHRAGMMPRW